MKKTFFVFLLLAAGLFITLFPAGHVYAEKPYKTCSPKEVHPIWWKARVNYDVQAKVLKAGKNHPKTGKKITLKKGKTVLLISYNRKGSKKIMLKDGTRCSVPRSAVSIVNRRGTSQPANAPVTSISRAYR